MKKQKEKLLKIMYLFLIILLIGAVIALVIYNNNSKINIEKIGEIYCSCIGEEFITIDYKADSCENYKLTCSETEICGYFEKEKLVFDDDYVWFTEESGQYNIQNNILESYTCIGYSDGTNDFECTSFDGDKITVEGTCNFDEVYNDLKNR